ncbi:hypothetical protein ACLH0M_12630 [Aeromonas media]|uniref:Uncharacterized protein n=1 Tax=Aeromonas sobria TaxID=646 RepID=A0A2N3IP98_AERSO|nr:hypothetical protein [Aeromonas sobria]PKQ72908.1 hypothetical protein AOX56_06280 [Aeromonas sobria]
MHAPQTESGQIPGKETLPANVPSLLQRCDNWLMGLCQRLCYWLGQFLLLGFGCWYIWTSFTTIFEYGEGMADLDIVEKGTLLLLALLLWRHWRYCQYCSTPYWQRLLRPLLSWGRLFVVGQVMVGIIFAIDASWLAEDAGRFQEYAIYERLLDYMLFLVALYLAAPRFQPLSPISSTEQVS